MSETTPPAPPPLNEGTLPEKAIGKILSTQQVASIEFSAKGGVTINMVSAPEHVLDKTAVLGFAVPPKEQVDSNRLKAQLDAMAKEGLLGPAARELAERAKEAVAKGQQETPGPVILPQSVVLHSAVPAPPAAQQVASTPTALAPESQIVVEKAPAAAPVATPASWAGRIGAEQSQMPVRQL